MRSYDLEGAIEGGGGYLLAEVFMVAVVVAGLPVEVLFFFSVLGDWLVWLVVRPWDLPLDLTAVR